MTVKSKALQAASLIGALTLAANAAHADALSTPAMSASIAANPNPLSFDAGFGKIYVTGSLTGLAFAQSNAENAYPGDGSTGLDLDNAMISVQKTDGMFQFYVQAGLYSSPTVGQPYDKATDQNSLLGPVPVAYGKLQLTDEFSIEAGKLPTLVGAEYAFTTQNLNIERGLLWWQEPIVSRGVQANYASGPLSVSVSWNDGYYSNVWNSFSGLISYAFDSSNTLAFDASITPNRDYYQGSQIFDLMYTWSSAPFTVGPYVQYQHLDNYKDYYSYDYSGSEWGVGILASYAIDFELWSLNGRFEYEASSGNGSLFSYGPGSKAWSLTFTPTYQKSIFFARAEFSYTGASDYYDESYCDTDSADAISADASSCYSYGYGFGKNGDKSGQIRGLFETGIVF